MQDRKPYLLVVRQLGGVGDVLMLSCVFRGLRETYPDHEIHLATDSLYLSGALLDIATHNPYINHIHRLPPYQATTQRTSNIWKDDFAGAPRFEDHLLYQKADFVIDLNTICAEYENGQNNAGLKIEKPRWVIWCEEAGVIPSSYAPAYVITDYEKEAARAEFDNRHWFDGLVNVGLAVCAVDKKRSLTIGKLMEIAAEIKLRGARPIIIDMAHHFEGFDYIIGKRIKDVIPLLQCLDVMITVDSGALHMAGAAGTPVVGIFGPTDPAMRMGNYIGSATNVKPYVECAHCWYSFPCLRKNAPKRDALKCLESIQASAMVEEALRLAGRKV